MKKEKTLQDFKVIIYDEKDQIKDEQIIKSTGWMKSFREYERIFGRIGVDDSFESIKL